ncbi:MAG: hypothetical protein HC822_01400 [Oscillochloris sp.]|nr:hypothetical protein [Oscillochloris sp.]
MIPRWTLGPWWSRYWAYSDADFRKLVAEFVAYDLPLDVLVIDMDWHLPNSWTGYTWNRELLPDPPGLLAWLHNKGLRATLNLHPAEGVQPFEEAYPAFAAALGRDPASGATIPFCSSDPAFVEAYFRLLHHPLEADGVDFWWMDWQQGRMCELPGLDPLPWLNHLHYADLRRRSDTRPLVFSRWGGLGNHRYPIGFSGDTYATWEALRYQPYFTACAANVLYGWWSHDIGGHFGTTTPELYARWVQAGALSPILRLHSTKDPDAERLPWAFPEPVFQAARAAFHTRAALLPYFYSLAREHHERALSPCRPLYYGWPAAEAAYVAREQYMLGDQMLVAPIVHPADPANGLAAADLWVPPGQWIERSSGELFVGPKWHRVLGDLDTLPQLVRAGAILPLAPVTQRSDEQIGGSRIISIFPGAANTFRIYDDSGAPDSPGEWTPVTLALRDHGATYQVTVGAVEGEDPGLTAERTLMIRLERVESPQSVQVSGNVAHQWRYDAAEHSLIVEFPPLPKTLPLTVTFAADKPLSRATPERAAELRATAARRALDLADTIPADQLLDLALAATDRPAGQDALARLGGPFVRLFTYTTPEDAAQTLGRLVVSAAADRSPLSVRGTWRMIDAEGIHEQPLALENLSADTIVACPFHWDGRIAALGWELDLELHWREYRIRRHIPGPTLFATVGAGKILSIPATQAPPPEAVITSEGAPKPEYPWRFWQRETDHDEFQSLVERENIPFNIDFSAGDHIGYVSVSFRSPDIRPIIVAAQSFRPMRFFLNGAPLHVAHHAPADALKLNADWSRSVPGQLNPGDNHLLVVCDLRAADSTWRAFLHLMLLDANGHPAPDLVIMKP